MLNVLFISADDMSYGSTGISGCSLPNISPNLDWLGQNGVFFHNAHTTVGLCQPSRSVWMTGLYPWNNGATGFNNVYNHVATLIEILTKAKYQTGIIGKSEHLAPERKFKWNFKVPGYSDFLKYGLDQKLFYELTKSFLSNVSGPFFLMLNSHHPHRNFPQKSRYDPKEVNVPGFLPDIFETRQELSQYFEGVHRCDAMVGEAIKALKETGHYDNTLIIFTSDHGMAFPFVKACCYHFSTKVPLIWHCPKLFKPKEIDTFVSGIDIMPTILEVLQLKQPDMDGESYLKTLQTGVDFKNEVYTCLCRLFSGKPFETRAIHNKEYCYIKNFWSNGKQMFVEDGSLDQNLSVQGIRRTDKELYKKLRYRSHEELYDIQKDPFACENIVNLNINKKITMNKLINKYSKKYNDKVALNNASKTLNFLI